MEYFFAAQFPPIPQWKDVSGPAWKWIHYEAKPERTEIYRLTKDPHETRNLASDPAAATQRTRCESRLKALLVETT